MARQYRSIEALRKILYAYKALTLTTAAENLLVYRADTADLATGLNKLSTPPTRHTASDRQTLLRMPSVAKIENITSTSLKSA